MPQPRTLVISITDVDIETADQPTPVQNALNGFTLGYELGLLVGRMDTLRSIKTKYRLYKKKAKT